MYVLQKQLFHTHYIAFAMACSVHQLGDVFISIILRMFLACSVETGTLNYIICIQLSIIATPLILCSFVDSSDTQTHTYFA